MPQLQVILNLPIVCWALHWRGGGLLFLASCRCLCHAEALLQKASPPGSSSGCAGTRHSGGDQGRPQGAHLCPGAFGFLRGWGRICLSTSRTRKSTRSGALTLSNMAKGVSADDEGTLHQSQNNRHALHPLRTNIPELPVCKASSPSCSLQQPQVVQQLQRTQHSKQPGGYPEG